MVSINKGKYSSNPLTFGWNPSLLNLKGQNNSSTSKKGNEWSDVKQLESYEYNKGNEYTTKIK